MLAAGLVTNLSGGLMSHGVSHDIVIIAHRGVHSSSVGEDTVASQRRAYDMGVCAETDIRYSVDHKLIQSHDPNGKRVFGVDEEIAQTPYETIRTWRTIRGGQQPPNAQESFALVRQRGGCLYMEIPQQWPTARLQQLENEARAAGVLPYLHLYTPSKANLRWFHANAWDIGWKSYENPWSADINDLHPAFVLVRPQWRSAQTTNRLHANGVLAGGGFHNQTDFWSAMDRNDDLAITNFPAAAKIWRANHQ